MAPWSTSNSSSHANIDQIRQAIDQAGIHDARIQSYGTSKHQVIISLAQKETQESALDAGRQSIVRRAERQLC